MSFTVFQNAQAKQFLHYDRYYNKNASPTLTITLQFKGDDCEDSNTRERTIDCHEYLFSECILNQDAKECNEEEKSEKTNVKVHALTVPCSSQLAYDHFDSFMKFIYEPSSWSELISVLSSVDERIGVLLVADFFQYDALIKEVLAKSIAYLFLIIPRVRNYQHMIKDAIAVIAANVNNYHETHFAELNQQEMALVLNQGNFQQNHVYCGKVASIAAYWVLKNITTAKYDHDLDIIVNHINKSTVEGSAALLHMAFMCKEYMVAVPFTFPSLEACLAQMNSSYSSYYPILHMMHPQFIIKHFMTKDTSFQSPMKASFNNYNYNTPPFGYQTITYPEALLTVCETWSDIKDKAHVQEKLWEKVHTSWILQPVLLKILQSPYIEPTVKLLISARVVTERIIQ
jgi:hypothetical protein